MPFDPSTAALVDSGFDPSTAQLVKEPKTPAQIAARKAFDRSRQARLDRAEYSPANASVLDNVLAGAGQFLKSGEVGMAMNMGQVPRSAAAPFQAGNAPLLNTKAGMGGNIGMGILSTAPLMGIPAATPVLSAGALGAGLGFSQPAGSASEATINAAVGGAFGAGGQKISQVAGDKLSGAISNRLAARNAPLSEAEQKVQDAIKAGFKLTPMQAQSGGFSKTAASISGRPQLEREFSRHNAKLVNRLAQEEIGLPGKSTLDRAGIASKKAQANSVYNELSQLPDGQFDTAYQIQIGRVADRSGGGTFPGSNPEIDALKNYYKNITNFRSKDVVAKVRELRSDGYKNLEKIRNPAENALGKAQIEIADAMDDALQRHAAKVGKPALVKKYKDARVQLAKIHTIEDSIEGSDISAKSIASNIEGNPNIKGNFRKIADAYESFDRSFQDVSKIRDHPLGLLDYLAAAAGIGGTAAGGAAVGLPLVAARPLTRAALGSNVVQQMLAQPSRPGVTGLRLLQGGSGMIGRTSPFLPSYLPQQEGF